MAVFDEIDRRRRARTRQQRIEEDIQYRQSMREIDRGKRSIRALIEDFSNRAVEAERAGQHDQAVRFAMEARRLKQYEAGSGAINARIETAHAMTAAGRAMADIVGASGRLLESAARMSDPAALGELETGMLVLNESVDQLLEQNALLFEGMDTRTEREIDEAGEACLREIMDSRVKERRSRMLADTHQQLDRLQRLRAAEK